MSVVKVQSTTQAPNGVTSQTIALTSVGAGNLLVLTSDYFDGTQATNATPATPTDSNGTVAVGIAPLSVLSLGGQMGCAIFYVANTASGTHTLTVNPFSHTNAYSGFLTLTEYSGVVTSSPLDAAAIISADIENAGSTTTFNTGTGATLAQADELIVAAISVTAGAGLSNAGLSTAATGYTQVSVQQDSSANVAGETAFKETAATTGQIATWTFTSDSTMRGVQASLVAFKVASGGGDVSVALGGQSSTFTPGTFGISHAQALTGQAATFSAGTFGVSRSQALTGQAATFTAGTLTPGTSLGLTGVMSLFVAGLMLPSGGTPNLGFIPRPANPALSSPTNSLQFAVLRSFTTPSPDVTVGLTGQRSTFASGALVPNLALALTGQSALFAPGVMGASAGGNVTVALVGQGSVFTPGQMLAGVSIALTGQSATFTPGTVTKGISVSLVGQGATFRAGNVTPSGGTPVIGPQVTLVGFIANVGSMMVH